MQARYGAAAAPPLRGVTPEARPSDLHHIWRKGCVASSRRPTVLGAFRVAALYLAGCWLILGRRVTNHGPSRSSYLNGPSPG
jgi:hypothetical protein